MQSVWLNNVPLPQGSSIGRYTADWIRGFRISAAGGNGYDAWLSMSAKAIKEQSYPDKDLMKILYPTLETVDAAGRFVSGAISFPLWPDSYFQNSAWGLNVSQPVYLGGEKLPKTVIP